MTCKIKPIILVLFLISCSLSCAEQPPLKKVCFQNVCVQAEIADTESKREIGLMFRKSLPKNQGMLFIFDSEEKYSFWMKNMRIPLDIIYIRQDKRIVDIKTNIPPCKEACPSLIPGAKAKYVLEVNAGFSKKNKVNIGDKVSF